MFIQFFLRNIANLTIPIFIRNLVQVKGLTENFSDKKIKI